MSDKAAKKTFKMHKKLNVIYHPESMLVIKSKEERVAIGRIENDTVVDLDEEALRLCEEHGVDYDHSLVEEDENDSEEQQSEEPHSDNDEKVEQPTSVVPIVVPTTQGTKTISQDDKPQTVVSNSSLNTKQSVEGVQYEAYLGELKQFIDSLVTANEVKNGEITRLTTAVTVLNAEVEKLKKTNRALLVTIAAST